MLCKQGLGDLGTEVSKVYAERVTLCLLDILQCIYHIDLALDDGNGALIDISSAVLLGVSIHQCFSSVDCQGSGETVTAYTDNTNFYLR